jgi:hypothetical protein
MIMLLLWARFILLAALLVFGAALLWAAVTEQA